MIACFLEGAAGGYGLNMLPERVLSAALLSVLSLVALVWTVARYLATVRVEITDGEGVE